MPLQPGPDVGQPAEALLGLPVGAADQLGVEAGPGHHREVLAVEPAEVERRSRPCSAISTAARLLRDAEVGGEQVRGAGRQHADGTPEPASASMQRCTIPSPPQTRTSSAPASMASRARFGAFWTSCTSYQSGSSTPAASRPPAARPARHRGGSSCGGRPPRRSRSGAQSPSVTAGSSGRVEVATGRCTRFPRYLSRRASSVRPGAARAARGSRAASTSATVTPGHVVRGGTDRGGPPVQAQRGVGVHQRLADRFGVGHQHHRAEQVAVPGQALRRPDELRGARRVDAELARAVLPGHGPDPGRDAERAQPRREVLAPARRTARGSRRAGAGGGRRGRAPARPRGTRRAARPRAGPPARTRAERAAS